MPIMVQLTEPFSLGTPGCKGEARGQVTTKVRVSVIKNILCLLKLCPERIEKRKKCLDKGS